MDTSPEKKLSMFNDTFHAMRNEIQKIVVGHDSIIKGILMSLISRGNVLLEGVPGIGKTLLVKTLSQVLDLRYSRIQFTPDLMPADIIGTKVILESESGAREYEFRPGPIFSNIILADEINRSAPKTQSALLEVMQEHTVTVGGTTYVMEEPYIVLATQNPIEMEGTYPLPEAQKDRFFFQLNVTYPNEQELLEIGRRFTTGQIQTIKKIADAEILKSMMDTASQVPVPESAEEFAVKLVSSTHPQNSISSPMVKRYVKYGASPRALVALLQSAKINALLSNRYNVSNDDISCMLHPCLRHRLILTFEAEAEGVNVDEIIDTILEKFSQHA